MKSRQSVDNLVRQSTDINEGTGIGTTIGKTLQTPWMGPLEAAAYLGIALGTLRNWTSAKFVPHSKRGRVVRYHRDVLDRWLNRGACPGRSTFADKK
jgi:excisionase family DNA binding protein